MILIACTAVPAAKVSDESSGPAKFVRDRQITTQTPPTLLTTPTPAPQMPSAGIHTSAALKALLSSFPPEYMCFLDEQTVVRFAYPSGSIDWAGFAFIDHVPSVSSVTLRRPYRIIRKDGIVSREEGEMLYGQELVVRRHYESDEGESSLDAILEDENVMQRILAGPEECQSIIPEEAARDAIRMIALGGPAEAEPGFGGLFLDRDDNSIAYVYMLDPSQQEEAEEAARKELGETEFSRIREVRTLQGQYSMSQLTRWYEWVRNSIWEVEGIQFTDLNEAKNRIQIGMSPRPGARVEMQDIVDSVSVPLGAVIIEVGCSDVGSLYQPPPLPDDPIYRNIESRVEAPSEVSLGENVPFVLRLKNVGSEPVSLEYGLGYDFVVTRIDGGKVWNRQCEVGVVIAILKGIVLDPGEDFVHEAEWGQWDNQGAMVQPGEYLVYGVFDCLPEIATEPQKLTILP